MDIDVLSRNLVGILVLLTAVHYCALWISINWLGCNPVNDCRSNKRRFLRM